MVINAIDEVLFWEDISAVTKKIEELTKKYYPNDPQSYFGEKESFLRKTIPTKSDFLRRIEHYEKYGSPTWIAGRNPCCDDLGIDLLRKAIACRGSENGSQKARQAERIIARDPAFWEYYADRILCGKENAVLELTVGAGLGTSAIMRKMKGIYFGVDIDFVCAKTADALADHYNVRGLGIATSLWNLPFDDSTFSAICSNCGLEECREVPQILSEAARVLRPGGSLVLHLISPERSVWQSYFDLYDFTKEEICDCLRRARLIADLDTTRRILRGLGLALAEQRHDARKGCIAVYKKQS